MILSKKIFLLSLAFIFKCCDITSQNDIIWYDENNKEVAEELGTYYRLPITEKDGLYLIQYYYKNGKPRLLGTSLKKERQFWQGSVKVFNKDGGISYAANYENNLLHGELITYYNNQKLRAIYSKGFLISGKANFYTDEISSNTYTERNDSIIKEVTYRKDLKGIRYEKFTVANGTIPKEIKVDYYGDQGVFLGTYTKSSNLYESKGTEVTYYKNPLRVQQIEKSDENGKIVIACYYENGQLREKFSELPSPKIDYFSLKGERISTVKVDGYDKDGWNYYDGKLIEFYSDDNPDEMDLLYGTQEFDQIGNTIKVIYFHKNQKVESITNYENNIIKETYSYNKDGDQIAHILYKDESPYKGTLIEDNTATVYEEGEVLKKTTYYGDSKIIFSVYDTKKAVYFNKKGEVIAEMTYTNSNGKKEKNGTEHFIDEEGRIARTLRYEKNKNTYDKMYTYNDTIVSIKERYLEGYYKVKDVIYYENSEKIRSILHYKNGNEYEEEFYDLNGKKIGEYNLKLKEGTLYTYFPSGDRIQSIQKFQMGTLVKSKVYKQNLNPYSSRYKEYVLVKNLDINEKAIHYDEEGEIIASLTYKQGKPFEGILYDTYGPTFYTIKEGKKNGPYKKMYLNRIKEEGMFTNDLKDGLFTTYNLEGNIVSERKYANGKLEGKSITYNSKGEVIHSMRYKANEPYEGTNVRNGVIYIYKNGRLIETTETIKNETVVTRLIEDGLLKVVMYKINTKQKKLEYSLKNNNLHDTIIRYDEEGKKLRTALFDNGKMRSGEILIAPDYNYSKTIRKVLVRIENKTLFFKGYDSEGKLQMDTKEIADSEGKFKNTIKLAGYLNYIEPEQIL